MFSRVKLIPQRIYVKLCKDQPIDVFMTNIFQSFTWFGESFSMWFFKNWILPYRFMARVTKKNLIGLPRYECYAQVLNYLLLKQSNSFRFLRQYYHYYQRYINPVAIKIRKHF